MVVSVKAGQLLFNSSQISREWLPIAKKVDDWSQMHDESWARPPMPRVLLMPLVTLKVDYAILKKIWVFTEEEVMKATNPRR